MKGIYLIKQGPADQAFEMREMQLAEPKPTEVLIKVSHFGLNYADVMARLGLYNDCPPLPCVLGYEAVGHILKKGSEVKNLSEGDLVLAFTKFGGYADHLVADQLGVIRLAPGTSEAEATALATQYCTAWFAACKMTNLFPGDRVLIHAAAGGVGTALTQIAKWKGCITFGTAGSQEKLTHIKNAGIDHPINYREKEFDEEIIKILGDKRIDVVFDPIGGKSFKKGMSILGSGGRMITYGASEWSGTKGNLFDKINLAFGFGFLHPIGLLMKSKSVLGVNMLRIAENKPNYLQQCMLEVYDAYQQGILKPAVDSVFDVKDIAKAHAKLENRDTIGKVAVKW
jgi:NADPH:quinone reductase-like Zn-dependent oxidoreductase